LKEGAATNEDWMAAATQLAKEINGWWFTWDRFKALNANKCTAIHNF
jgi:hypothetical protein